jgi:ATP-dependent DNA ligase
LTTKSLPTGEDGSIHEPKLECYRLHVVKDGATVRLYSRRGHDWGKRRAGPDALAPP